MSYWPQHVCLSTVADTSLPQSGYLETTLRQSGRQGISHRCSNYKSCKKLLLGPDSSEYWLGLVSWRLVTLEVQTKLGFLLVLSEFHGSFLVNCLFLPLFIRPWPSPLFQDHRNLETQVDSLWTPSTRVTTGMRKRKASWGGLGGPEKEYRWVWGPTERATQPKVFHQGKKFYFLQKAV